MNIYKNYTVRIDANTGKETVLNDILADLSKLSEHLFYNFHNLTASNQNQAYKLARESYPNVPSKIIQNYIKQYYTLKKSGKKLKKPAKPGIFLDQNFKFVINDNKLTKYWIKFNKLYFPLMGKYLNKYVQNENQVHFAHIYKKQNKIYCRLTLKVESDVLYTNSDEKDNAENGYTFIRNVIHSTDLHAKTRDSIRAELHKATTQIKNDLIEFGTEVLFLPNRDTFVNNTFEEETIIDGNKIRKNLNSFPYRLLIDILKQKCLECGISIITDPKKVKISESKVEANARSHYERMIEYSSKRKRKIPKIVGGEYLNSRKYDGPTLLMSHNNSNDSKAMAVRIRRTLEKLTKEKSNYNLTAYGFEAIMVEFFCHKMIVKNEIVTKKLVYEYVEDYFHKTISKVSIEEWIKNNAEKIFPEIQLLLESETNWTKYIRIVVDKFATYYTDRFYNCLYSYMRKYYKDVKTYIYKDYFIRSEIPQNVDVKMFTPIQFASIDYSQMPYLFC